MFVSSDTPTRYRPLTLFRLTSRFPVAYVCLLPVVRALHYLGLGCGFMVRCAQQLAGDILDDPVHVHIGGFNLTANEDIHQVSVRVWL